MAQLHLVGVKMKMELWKNHLHSWYDFWNKPVGEPEGSAEEIKKEYLFDIILRRMWFTTEVESAYNIKGR